jgi:hypothetical protein
METAMPCAAISRRLFLFGIGLSGGLMAGASLAETQTPPAPIVVYDNALGPGWYDQSWAFVEMPIYVGPTNSIRVRGGPRTTLALEHSPLSTSGYAKLSFYINGGDGGGQSIAVMVLIDGKPFDAHYILQPQAGKWSRIEVPLGDLGAANTRIDGLWFQGLETYGPYLLAKIMFE